MTGRNVELTREAGRLRCHGKSPEEIETDLLNHPSRNGLPPAEIRAIAKSIGAKPPGTKIEPPPNGWSSALHELADRRGWPVTALKALGAVAKGAEVHIPMKLAGGQVVGWRRRRADGQLFKGAGKKALTVKGGRAMLIMPQAIPADIPLAVTESETDAAAIIAAGHSAVVATPGGKPSVSCIAELQKVVAGGTAVLFPDPDQVGDAWRMTVGTALIRAGCTVRYLPPVDSDIDARLRRDQDPRGSLARLISEAIPLTECAHHDRLPRNEAVILDEAPKEIARPLCLVDGHAYAATWVAVTETIHSEMQKDGTQRRHVPPLVRTIEHMVIVRDDGTLFANADVSGASSLGELKLSVTLPEPLPAARRWSGLGLKRYLKGDRPDPAEVFGRVVRVVDHFMDFSRSFGAQRDLSEFIGIYVLATYLLDAFNVIGYLWPNGAHGAGKSHLLQTVVELAYLGQFILAGGSYASLRDLANYGATLAFDDCENIMDPKRSDPDKRTLLLAGNRRGATVTVKEPNGKHGWVTRHINAFCPRLFSAIRLPDPVLASRTVTIPLIRSGDERRTKLDPVDHEAWPCDRGRLIDDLWAVGLSALPVIKEFDKKASEQTTLAGRNFEPWRAVFAVSLWLDKQGVTELFDRMRALADGYQKERGSIEESDPMRLAIMALVDLLKERSFMEFETALLSEQINQLSIEAELTGGDEPFTNVKRVGRMLERLRFTKAQRTSRRKRWTITRDELDALARSYGIPIPSQQNGIPAQTALEQAGEVPSVPFVDRCRLDRRVDGEASIVVGPTADGEVF